MWTRVLALPKFLHPLPQHPILTLFTPRKELVPIRFSIIRQTSLANLFLQVAIRIFMLLFAPYRKTYSNWSSHGSPNREKSCNRLFTLDPEDNLPSWYFFLHISLLFFSQLQTNTFGLMVLFLFIRTSVCDLTVWDSFLPLYPVYLSEWNLESGRTIKNN